MSKLRNRNIRNVVPFKFKENTFKIRDENKNIIENIDGKKWHNLTPFTYDSGVEIRSGAEIPSKKLSIQDLPSYSSFGSSDIDLIEFLNNADSVGPSSCSTISWDEDYETNATENVREEYERMDRVLQCLEPIPTYYNKQEYKLWIKTFPCLSLIDGTSKHQYLELAVKNNYRSKSNLECNIEETCDKPTSKQKTLNVNTSKGKSSKDKVNTRPKDTINTTINPHTLSLRFESFVTISSPQIRPEYNRHTSWLEDIAEFVSLPVLKTPNFVGDKGQRAPPARPDRKSSELTVLLPPIERKCSAKRSVSAMPQITSVEPDAVNWRRRRRQNDSNRMTYSDTALIGRKLNVAAAVPKRTDLN